MKKEDAINKFSKEEQEIIKRFLALYHNKMGRPVNPDSIAQKARRMGISRQALFKKLKKRGK